MAEAREPQARPTAPFGRAKDWRSMSRRELLKVSPLVVLGAFAVEKWQDPLLQTGVDFSDWAADKLFRTSALAETFPDSKVAPLEKFPYNGYDVIDPGVDLANWKLTVTGAVDRPGEYTLAQIQALPKTRQNTRHVCVEGWDVIGNFGGTRISEFLKFVGADTKVRYITVTCADDYYESIDMASALQPQSLLCYEMYGKPLDAGHGAPLRLQLPTKLGYKQAKYITSLEVSNVIPAQRGYWEDQGYSWFGGL